MLQMELSTTEAIFIQEKIENVDMKTFEILDFSYAKDKNNVYKQGEKIDDMDSQTFKILDYKYIKDKNNEYQYCKKIEKN